MKDEKGYYYYPDPTDVKTRVYVQEGAGGIEFRLWRHDYPQVWEKHGWLAYDVIAAAAELYKEEKGHKTPLDLYDINVGRALLKEASRQEEKTH